MHVVHVKSPCSISSPFKSKKIPNFGGGDAGKMEQTGGATNLTVKEGLCCRVVLVSIVPSLKQ